MDPERCSKRPIAANEHPIIRDFSMIVRSANDKCLDIVLLSAGRVKRKQKREICPAEWTAAALISADLDRIHPSC